jgi:hypothetical protein
MDTALTPAVERIARVLAGQRISANAEGDQESASAAVDASWEQYRDDALAVLHTLRAPSEKMAAAGDTAIWERMILAAIAEARPAVVL